MKQGFEENTQLYKTSSNYLLREIAGEYLLIPIGGGAEQLNGMLTLNETFQFIWNQFQEARTIDDVVRAAGQEYEDNSGTMERDIRAFVEESLQYGFLVAVEE